jgi:hypothetical protein
LYAGDLLSFFHYRHILAGSKKCPGTTSVPLDELSLNPVPLLAEEEGPPQDGLSRL